MSFKPARGYAVSGKNIYTLFPPKKNKKKSTSLFEQDHHDATVIKSKYLTSRIPEAEMLQVSYTTVTGHHMALLASYKNTPYLVSMHLAVK